MVKKMSLYLAGVMVRNLHEPSAEAEVYAYGLENLINNVVELLLLIMLSLLLDLFVPAMLVLLAFAGLRIPGGGAHLGTFPRCLVSSVASILLLALCSQHVPDLGIWNVPVSMGIMALGLVIIVIRVPAGTQKKTVSEAALRQRQKYITATTLLIITAAAIILFEKGRGASAYALLAGGVWAFFIICPPGYRLFDTIDKIMDRKRR